MDRVTGLTAFFHNSEDAIYFENLINQLYIKNKKHIDNLDKETITAAILSNYRLSKSELNSFGRLGLYQYDRSSELTTSEEFEMQCIEFLGYIAKGYEYRENPIPGNEGSFHIRKGRNFPYPDDEDVWYGNYEGFFFRRSELVKFFPELEIDISDDIDDEKLVSTECVSEDWHGKETAWKMIAGLVIALGEVDKECRTAASDRVKISSIYHRAANTLVKHEGIEVETETLKKLLANVLKKYATNFLENNKTPKK
ncbi:hypothetical protein [Erwinia sp. Leaf53]|uniref:hypothetical protein n=1 Tax=Erwinia sp. Leaf53 TaxID=1736225 RepID=UPI00092EF97B|nr:hypothetical protein [Erwinia sp. Leaf53]